MTRRTRRALERTWLAVRGALLTGRAVRCPCCGARSRWFTMGGGSIRRRDRGYCPRCNAKARHRRVWLFATSQPGLLTGRILHVGPHRSLARALAGTTGVRVHGLDISDLPGVDTLGSATRMPFADDVFDGLLTVHVLEHLDDDRAAIAEMARVVRPGGWAIVNVPCDLERPTYEDASISTPEARRAAFGEADHRRHYGHDLVDRLTDGGFSVEVHPGDEVPDEDARRFGLTPDEVVFLCRLGGSG